MCSRSGFWGPGLSKIIVFFARVPFQGKGPDEWLTGTHERAGAGSIELSCGGREPGGCL